MAFPPTFTNTWDTTFPPDTQLANLLGQDLRNLRVDVMQRMSLLSGTFANRPTPEIVNATWGGAGYGLLYFSTDTNQVFQWNGAAWVDVTSNIGGARTIFKDNTSHTHTGTTTEDTIYTAPVQANQLGLNGTLRIFIAVNYSPQGAPTTILRVKFGGLLFFQDGIGSPAPLVIFYNIIISNRNAANSQLISSQINRINSSTVGQGSSSLDTTLAQNLTVTIQSGTNTDSQAFSEAIVELL